MCQSRSPVDEPPPPEITAHSRTAAGRQLSYVLCPVTCLLHYEIIGRYLQPHGPRAEGLRHIPPHLRPCRYAGWLRGHNPPGSGNGKIPSH